MIAVAHPEVELSDQAIDAWAELALALVEDELDQQEDDN